MLNKKIETRLLIASLLFTVLYCVYLFFVRNLLATLEKNPGEILKPEQGQIIAVGLLIIIYHFAFTGLFAFGSLGRLQAFITIFFSVAIHAGLLYGFKLWYDAIVEGVLIFLGNQQSLPWYADEKNKFLLVNVPLIFYFTIIFMYRILRLTKKQIPGARVS